jgi:hypothetical protein
MGHVGQHTLGAFAGQQVQQQAWPGRAPRWCRAAAPRPRRPGCLRCRFPWPRIHPGGGKASPSCGSTTVSATFLNGWPAKRLAKSPLQPCAGRPGKASRRHHPPRSRNWPARAAPPPRRVPPAAAPRRRPSRAAPSWRRPAPAPPHRPRFRRALGRIEAAGARIASLSVRKAGPAVPHVEHHAGLAQAVQPGAQQGRRFHVGGKHPARAAHVGGDAQGLRPFAQRGRVQRLEPRRDLGLARAVACGEHLRRLGMREVQPALAGQQELAAHRRHRVAQAHLHARG